jgi:ABC-type multidrug transport system permease subunit
VVWGVKVSCGPEALTHGVSLELSRTPRHNGGSSTIGISPFQNIWFLNTLYLDLLFIAVFFSVVIFVSLYWFFSLVYSSFQLPQIWTCGHCFWLWLMLCFVNLVVWGSLKIFCVPILFRSYFQFALLLVLILLFFKVLVYI